jgi:hypothetical protein
MEHLLHGCENYSAPLWAELSTAITITLQTTIGHAIAEIQLTPREIVFNAPHPSIMLHVPDKTSRLIFIMLIQEVRRNIIYRRMNRTERDRTPTPLIRLQAHLLSTISKLISYMEYQGISTQQNATQLLRTLQQTITDRIE